MIIQTEQQQQYLTIEITKTVPVADRETLEAFLNARLEKWATRTDDSDEPKRAGTKALNLIEEAGFTLTPPHIIRDDHKYR